MAKNGEVAAAFAAPGRYIPGRGAIHRIGEVLEQSGSSKPLILLDPMVKEIVGDALEKASRGLSTWTLTGSARPRR